MGLISLEGTLPAGSNLIYTRPADLIAANTLSIRLSNPAVNSVTLRKVKAVGPVTVQRFEEVKYNKLVKYEQEARGFFWVPEEISLTKDAQDFKDAST